METSFQPTHPRRRETCAQGRQAWGSGPQAAGTPGSALRVPTRDPGGLLAASATRSSPPFWLLRARGRLHFPLLGVLGGATQKRPPYPKTRAAAVPEETRATRRREWGNKALGRGLQVTPPSFQGCGVNCSFGETFHLPRGLHDLEEPGKAASVRSGDPGPQVKSELPGKAFTRKRGLRFSGWRLADSVPCPTLSCALCPPPSLVSGGSYAGKAKRRGSGMPETQL